MYGVANQTATEAFTSIRTVAAFSLGPHLSSQYNRAMVGSSRAGVAKANSAGASFGTSQFVVYATYGVRLCCCLRLPCLPGPAVADVTAHNSAMGSACLGFSGALNQHLSPSP